MTKYRWLMLLALVITAFAVTGCGDDDDDDGGGGALRRPPRKERRRPRS